MTNAADQKESKMISKPSVRLLMLVASHSTSGFPETDAVPVIRGR